MKLFALLPFVVAGCAALATKTVHAPNVEIWLQQQVGTAELSYDSVHARSLHPHAMITDLRVLIFDDDGDGQFQEGEERGSVAMHAATPTAAAMVRSLKARPGVRNPWLFARVVTTSGVEEYVWPAR